MPSGKREESAFKYLKAIAAAQPEEIRQRRLAAEQTYSTVLARLGAPGTYELPGTTGGAGAPAGGGFAVGRDVRPEAYIGAQEGKQAVGGAADYRKKIKEGVKGGGYITQEIQGAGITYNTKYGEYGRFGGALGTRLDPESYVANLEQTSQFRTMSRLTAEAEQMVAREGPLWEEMMKNQQLPIIEGAAAMARSNAEEIRRAMARGGAARRDAFEAVQRIRSQERINTQRIQQLTELRTKMDFWARDNARTTLEFGQNWAGNLGGIRESFNASMDKASELMSTSALPFMFAAQEKVNEWRYYSHGKKRASVSKWISGALSLVSLGLGGAGAMGMGGQAFQEQSGSFLGGGLAGLGSILQPNVQPPTGGGR